MTDDRFAKIDDSRQTGGPAAAFDTLIETLREQKQYHRLFDARLLKAKHELGIASTRPTSFEDVPDDQRADFEKQYIEAAREIGDLFLADNQIGQAWVYFRTIHEPEKVRQAFENIETRREYSEETEELINVALFEGAHPVKGLEIMLRTHGTCNTITALDQHMGNLGQEDRAGAAALLVNELYGELVAALQHAVEQRMVMPSASATIKELVAGRDWLFEGGNYHIDVSHLNSVVRFARSLEPDDPALPKAVELALYGTHLDEPLQYAGDPPFEDFFTASKLYLGALATGEADEALAYFRKKLDEEPDLQDKQMIAYVIVDLLSRLERFEAAAELSQEYLNSIEDPDGFSFSDLCRKAGRLDLLQKVAREQGDLVRYTAALIQSDS